MAGFPHDGAVYTDAARPDHVGRMTARSEAGTGQHELKAHRFPRGVRERRARAVRGGS